MTQPFISVRDVGKTYYPNKKTIKEALKAATFDLFPGEVLSLLGVNGAGKTTLSSILASLHPPTTGDILWKGRIRTRRVSPLLDLLERFVEIYSSSRLSWN